MTVENTEDSTQSLGESEKKQNKWLPEENALIISLRGKQMKWDEISKQLPGRSSVSCRLHYQNYLERPEWDEDKRNKLARLYEKYAENVCHPKMAEETNY